jgi:hypothetical protein
MDTPKHKTIYIIKSDIRELNKAYSLAAAKMLLSINKSECCHDVYVEVCKYSDTTGEWSVNIVDKL